MGLTWIKTRSINSLKYVNEARVIYSTLTSWLDSIHIPKTKPQSLVKGEGEAASVQMYPYSWKINQGTFKRRSE